MRNLNSSPSWKDRPAFLLVTALRVWSPASSWPGPWGVVGPLLPALSPPVLKGSLPTLSRGVRAARSAPRSPRHKSELLKTRSLLSRGRCSSLREARPAAVGDARGGPTQSLAEASRGKRPAPCPHPLCSRVRTASCLLRGRHALPGTVLTRALWRASRQEQAPGALLLVPKGGFQSSRQAVVRDAGSERKGTCGLHRATREPLWVGVDGTRSWQPP